MLKKLPTVFIPIEAPILIEVSFDSHEKIEIPILIEVHVLLLIFFYF